MRKVLLGIGRDVFEVLSRTLPVGTEKTSPHTSVRRIDGILAEIRTQYLPNTSTPFLSVEVHCFT
jgi:hypothetical protein